MKARTTNCVECRKAVYKEAETAYQRNSTVFQIRIQYGVLRCAVLTGYGFEDGKELKQYISSYTMICACIHSGNVRQSKDNMTDIMHA